MKNVHDRFTKSILPAALADVARLETNREILGHVPIAEQCMEPIPGSSARLTALGTLGRMVAAGPGLLGRDHTFREAARELAALPADNHPLTGLIGALRRVLIKFRRRSNQHQLGEDTMPTQSDLIAAYDEWEHKTRSEGRREGRREVLIEAIEGYCEILDIHLTGPGLRELARWDVAALGRAMATLRETRCWPNSRA